MRRPTVIHPEITPPPPSDRLYPGRPDSARPGIGGPIAFQSPSVHTSKLREIHMDERRWHVVGYSGRNSHEPKMIFKEFQDQSHNFLSVDGVCQLCVVIQNVSGIEESPF